MKICIDISQIVYPGGVGAYTKKLVENLLKIDRKNQYLLFAYSLRKKYFFENFTKSLSKYHNWRQKFFVFPISLVEPLANKFRWPRLEKLVGKVDIYHASDWVQFPAEAKIVTTVHDLAPIIYSQYHDKKIINVHRRRLELARTYADSIIVVSENTKKDFLKLYPYPEEKIKVIYEAPAISPDLSKEPLNRHSQDVLPKKPYILTVSSLNPRKNIKKLIQAFTIFRQKHSLYDLIVVGDFGWGERFDNHTHIRFINHVSQKRLAEHYRGAELFVYPSLYEGFGLPVLEAMSFGVPVVTSNASSLPEIAGDAAVLVDPTSTQAIVNGMEKALGEKNKLIRLGRERIKQFSWVKCAIKTLSVYNSLVSKSEIRISKT